MIGEEKFDCPMCGGNKKITDFQNDSGHTLGYICDGCGEHFTPSSTLDTEHKNVILLGIRQNPEFLKVSATSKTSVIENIKAQNEFLASGGKTHLETYVIGVVPMFKK